MKLPPQRQGVYSYKKGASHCGCGWAGHFELGTTWNFPPLGSSCWGSGCLISRKRACRKIRAWRMLVFIYDLCSSRFEMCAITWFLLFDYCCHETHSGCCGSHSSRWCHQENQSSTCLGNLQAVSWCCSGLGFPRRKVSCMVVSWCCSWSFPKPKDVDVK